jgi:hypothetical protein
LLQKGYRPTAAIFLSQTSAVVVARGEVPMSKIPMNIGVVYRDATPGNRPGHRPRESKTFHVAGGQILCATEIRRAESPKGQPVDGSTRLTAGKLRAR